LIPGSKGYFVLHFVVKPIQQSQPASSGGSVVNSKYEAKQYIDWVMAQPNKE
jgi:hypothetical protein